MESQHVSATVALVNSADEQHRLEELIDSVKPPMPQQARAIHYLLATPFRYPPLRHGSRFGRRSERGIWYGSDTAETALAETAYYRFVFLDGTAADLPHLETRHTLFRARIDTEHGIDLSRPPFTEYHNLLCHPSDYAATQRLGSDMRQDGVMAFRFPSARDPARGTNVAAFDPGAFATPGQPTAFQEWICVTTPTNVTFIRRAPLATSPTRIDFVLEQFSISGRLPRPAS